MLKVVLTFVPLAVGLLVAMALVDCTLEEKEETYPSMRTFVSDDHDDIQIEQWSLVDNISVRLVGDLEIDSAEEIATEIIDYGPENVMTAAIDVAAVFSSILSMQPTFRLGAQGGYDRALDLAFLFYKYGTIYSINPHILATVAMRESSLRLDTEQGYHLRGGRKIFNCRHCRGGRGEVGLFQLMPNGAAARLRDDDCDLFDRECNTRTAAYYLYRCRVSMRNRYRGAGTSAMLAAYARRTPLPPSEARRAHDVRRAKRILCGARRDCERIWGD